MRLKSAACGQPATTFTVKLDDSRPNVQAEAGKALIYVIEDQRFKVVRDVTLRIGIDGKWLGATRGDSYIFLSVDPGDHHLCAEWTSEFIPGGHLFSLAKISAEPGETYYFRARTSGSASNDQSSSRMLPTLDLNLVDTDAGQLLVAGAAFSDSRAKK
jgi:hypothetical protein